MSGDAGDELFGGYNRYFWGPRIWQKFSWMPFFVRNIIGNSMDLVPSYALNHLEKNISKYSKKNITKIANKFSKVSKGLKSSRNIDDLYLKYFGKKQIVRWINSSSHFFVNGEDIGYLVGSKNLLNLKMSGLQNTNGQLNRSSQNSFKTHILF